MDAHQLQNMLTSGDDLHSHQELLEAPEAKRVRLDNLVAPAGDPGQDGDRLPAGDSSEAAKSGKNGRSGRSILNHVATEQRRRDRINEGFAQMRDLIPHKVKMDKATFLQQVVEYIKQLQGALGQVVSLRTGSAVPEDLQWQIQMLLPSDKKATPTQPAAAPVAASGFGTNTTGSAFYPFVVPQQAPAAAVSSGMVANKTGNVDSKAAAQPALAQPVGQNLTALQNALQLQQSMQAMGIDLQSLVQLQSLLVPQQQQQQPPAAAPSLNIQPQGQGAATHPGLWQPQQCVPPQNATVSMPVGEHCSPSGEGEVDNSEPNGDGNGTKPEAARKTAAKVRRCTTAAKVLKPDMAMPAPTAQPGRPDLAAM